MTKRKIIDYHNRMELYKKLHNAVKAASETVKIDKIQIGISYTAVTTSDGGCGLSFTFLKGRKSCTVVKDPMDYEGSYAKEALGLLFSSEIVERSVALALVNALNYSKANSMKTDSGTLFRDLKIKPRGRISMVGYFGPVIRELEKIQVQTEILDNGRDMGSKETFYRNLKEGNTDALILTSTSIINGSTEEILSSLSPGIPCVMLGPTTPMIPESFSHLPVNILAGTVPLDFDGVFKAVRHGKGTPVIQKSCKKVYTTL